MLIEFASEVTPVTGEQYFPATSETGHNSLHPSGVYAKALFCYTAVSRARMPC
jgi:hypothetical protein